MPGRLVVDGIELARSGKALAGKIPVHDLDRLQDALFAAEGEVEYTLSGGQNPHGRPMLHLRVTGRLALTCQRCLGPLEYPVAIRADFLLLRDERELADMVDDAEDAVDTIVGSHAMDVADMVEDEILLGLPYAPRHAAGKCRPAGGTGVQAGAADAAFAALAKLKKRSN